MARLDKKNDDRLSQYFKEFLAMCKRVCGRATDEEIILGKLSFEYDLETMVDSYTGYLCRLSTSPQIFCTCPEN